jgi:CubicO group peptidase (beta-lactamase class C family)
MKKLRIVTCVLILLLPLLPLFTQSLSAEQDGENHRYPGETWLRYATPEEAGWSSKKLEVARSYFDMIDSAALLVVHNGAIVVSWGNVDTKYWCHSIRKSYLSALYGIYVNEGYIDMNKTLAELNIYDVPPITEEEKQAKVIHLIKARSGVYHPAAAETAGMKASRPERGSHPPDTFWYYNNWDFNVLGTIFEQETGTGIFMAFKNRIADPLQMEDFVLEEDTSYFYELEYSIHPAYPFKMTARDMARFGYLFLRNGNWNGVQIIPGWWINESTFPYSHASEDIGYGYLWWVLTWDYFKDLGIYYASGYRGHSIFVVPGADTVVVHRVDTYTEDDYVYSIQELILLDLVLKARISGPNPEPVLEPGVKAEMENEE